MSARYVPTVAARGAVQGREVDIIRSLGISWRSGSQHIHCPYPDHPDKNPSWRLLEDGRVVCTCDGGKTHSIFDAIMRMRGLDFEQSKITAVEMIGRPDLIVDPDASSADGLTLAQYAEAKQLPLDFLRELGLRDAKLGQRPAVAIPFLDAAGQLSGTHFRLSLGGPKDDRFRWRRGSKMCAYGAHQAAHFKAAGYAVIVEGESDCHTLWHNGFPALGLPGAALWKEERDAPLLEDVPIVYVIVEPDLGGAQTLNWLCKSGVASRVRTVRLPPETKDPSALYLADTDGFREAFQAALDAATPFDVAQHHVADDEDAPTNEADFEASENGQRPVIKIWGGGLPTYVDKAERKLIERDTELFQRGDFIVRPAREMIAIADHRQTPGMRLVPVGTPYLAEHLTRLIDFQRFDARSQEWVSINCPTQVASTYLARVGKWRLRPIAGLINCPTLRPDGSILEQPGYDPTTKLLYTPSMNYSAIPSEPTKDQARAALAVLSGLIDKFPFVGKDGDDATGKPSPSRSVALSTMMTAVIRRSIPHAPMHAFDAPVMGSGKSMLVDITSMIATGHAAPVITQGKDENEMEKRLGAMLLAGDPLISFDNCEQPLGGELLCQALTQSTIKVRILGKSETPTMPSNATYCATGNNLVITGDMIRRTIMGSLDPRVERPELRQFDSDPISIIRDDRDLYVSAVLVVLRAYVVAGMPTQGTQPLGSFEEWSRLVRDALLWLDEPDPCDTMEKTRVGDPELQALGEVLHHWHEEIGESEVSVKRVIEKATAKEGGGANDPLSTPTFKYPDFREALLVVAEAGGVINSRRLGAWLSSKNGKIVNDLRVERGLGATREGVARWRVVSTKMQG